MKTGDKPGQDRALVLRHRLVRVEAPGSQDGYSREPG